MTEREGLNQKPSSTSTSGFGSLFLSECPCNFVALVIHVKQYSLPHSFCRFIPLLLLHHFLSFPLVAYFALILPSFMASLMTEWGTCLSSRFFDCPWIYEEKRREEEEKRTRRRRRRGITRRSSLKVCGKERERDGYAFEEGIRSQNRQRKRQEIPADKTQFTGSISISSIPHKTRRVTGREVFRDTSFPLFLFFFQTLFDCS